MPREWWHATPAGRRRIPDVNEPPESGGFRDRCRAGAILMATAAGQPTRLFLDPVVQAARRDWPAALAASLAGPDFPVALHLLCAADWHACGADTPEALQAVAAAWTGLADRRAWASTRLSAPARLPPELAAIAAGIAPLTTGRYNSATALLMVARRRLAAEEAMLATAAADGMVTGIDHDAADGAGPPRIALAEVADWVVEAAHTGIAVAARDALTPAGPWLVMLPTGLADPQGTTLPAVAVLRLPAAAATAGGDIGLAAGR